MNLVCQSLVNSFVGGGGGGGGFLYREILVIGPAFCQRWLWGLIITWFLYRVLGECYIETKPLIHQFINGCNLKIVVCWASVREQAFLTGGHIRIFLIGLLARTGVNKSLIYQLVQGCNREIVVCDNHPFLIGLLSSTIVTNSLIYYSIKRCKMK